jgi:prepilin-type N-terminal cleavage/methylation domain-containing protein
MTLPFSQNPDGSQGVTLLEALVVLSIISMVSAAALWMRGGTSATLELERMASARIEELSRIQDMAIRRSKPAELSFPDACGGPGTIWLFPGGTAQGPDLCLSHDELDLVLSLDPLTGRFFHKEAP